MVPMPYEALQVLGASVFNPSGSESFSLKISASWQDTYISTAAKACGVPRAGSSFRKASHTETVSHGATVRQHKFLDMKIGP